MKTKKRVTTSKARPPLIALTAIAVAMMLTAIATADNSPATPAPAPAEEKATQTEIQSDRGSMNFRTGEALFEGNVLVVDQDVTMTSDKLTAKLDSNNQIISLEARGNVVITQPVQDRVARSGYALYTVEDRTVILMEKPRLEVGTSILDNAYRIVYNMDSELITTEAEPGRRTTVVIPAGGDRREGRTEPSPNPQRSQP